MILKKVNIVIVNQKGINSDWIEGVIAFHLGDPKVGRADLMISPVVAVFVLVDLQ